MLSIFRFQENLEKLKNLYIDRKLSQRKCAEIMNVSQTAVKTGLKKLNIKPRDLSESHKGQITWNKDLTKETDPRIAKYAKKVSLTRKQKTFEELYGIEGARKLKEKRRKARQGKTYDEIYGIGEGEKMRKKLSDIKLKGKPPITPLRFQIRNSFKYRQWRSDVFTKDDFTCQECGRRGGKLNVHHIKPFSLILELNNIRNFKEALECSELWDINNGITLCEKCHKKKRHKPDELVEVVISNEGKT